MILLYIVLCGGSYIELYTVLILAAFSVLVLIPYTGTGWLVFWSVFPGVLALLSLYCMFVVLYHTVGGEGLTSPVAAACPS